MERAFLEQAAQVNVADRELMENGEKVEEHILMYTILSSYSNVISYRKESTCLSRQRLKCKSDKAAIFHSIELAFVCLLWLEVCQLKSLLKSSFGIQNTFNK